MARLRYDGESGCYVGVRLRVCDTTMVRRIQQLTADNLQRGADAVEAAEAAWQAALEESAWQVGETGVERLPAGPRE